MWTPRHDEILDICTEILESKGKKSQGAFGFVPEIPYGYKLSALVMAYHWEQATGQVVVNPFCLQANSLMEIDEVWLKARSTFYEWLDWAEQNKQNADGIVK